MLPDQAGRAAVLSGRPATPDVSTNAASTNAASTNAASVLPLPRTPAAPGIARRHVVALCPGWSPDRLELARLLTSELVTNAVVHGSGPVTLTAWHTGAGLRIDVRDADPTCPAPRTDSGRLREHGRGLALVAMLADRWGAEPLAVGKCVWFELAGGPAGARPRSPFAGRSPGHIVGVRAPTPEEHR